jgi:cytochrome c oxidase cbb3-type subunit IV
VHLLELMTTVVTIVWFVAFVGLWVWAWSGRRRKDFAAAAQLPFDEESR